MWFKQEWIDPQSGVMGAVIERLMDHFRAGDRVDLRQVTIVLPSAAASRRLLQRLVVRCAELNCELSPPHLTTVGHLPELLYPSGKPFADELMQVFAWAGALKETAEEKLRCVMAEPPQADDSEAWLDLASTLQSVHRELSSEGISMQQVAELLGKEAGFEFRRWQALAEVQGRYLRRLDELGYWDRQTARVFAVEHRECRASGVLILIGAVDLNQVMRQMLEQVADHVWLMQVAASDEQPGFDCHGCLNESYWTSTPISLDAVQRVIVESHEDQAAAAIEFLQQAASEAKGDEIVLGALDESLEPYVDRIGDRVGLYFSWSAGETMEQQGVYRLLQQLLDWLSSRTFRALAALARHPMVFEQVSQQLNSSAWLAELDDYQTTHLPSLIAPAETTQTALRVAALIDQWCRDVTSSQSQALGDWKEAWFRTLTQLLGDRLLDREGECAGQLRVLEALRDIWSSAAAVPRSLQPMVSAPAAQRWLLRRIARQRFLAETSEAALPVIGWLDLPWSDSTHAVVLGFNEGFVPTPEPLDPLLPNSLRRKLGVMHSSRRYVRDAYYLRLLVGSQRRLRLVAGKRQPSGDPLVPSRLWFADRDEVLVDRALEAFHHPALSYELLEENDPQQVGKLQSWQLPLPDPQRVPQYLSPTDFEKFLACPYRFYLSRICRLQGSDDQSEELSASQFGDIAHAVLASFGKSDLRDSTDPVAIASLLQQQLALEVQQRIAREHLPAVDLQIEQLRRRLLAFAEQQANWANEGWEIEAVEFPVEATLSTNSNRLITIRGRIDRIDRHRDGKRWALLDYKTSESGKGPDETHRKSGEWINLQLPLYQWLIENQNEQELDDKLRASERSAGKTRRQGTRQPGEQTERQFQLGFILLGSDVETNQFELAKWTASEIEDAVSVAAIVADGLLDGHFWPPTELKDRQREYDDYDRLMQLPWPELKASESPGSTIAGHESGASEPA